MRAGRVERLATEFEWEAASGGRAVEGKLLDSGRLMPTHVVADSSHVTPEAVCLGIAGSGRPALTWGIRDSGPLAGSLGEYNGKFMSGQMVLRGGSCATPAGMCGQVTGISFRRKRGGSFPGFVWRGRAPWCIQSAIWESPLFPQLMLEQKTS